MEKPIIWSTTALNQLQEIYFFLLYKTKSSSIAENVVDTIYNSVTNLKNNPEIYELDEMKDFNDGYFRAYEKYNYRISYKISDKDILIVRVIHTSRNPTFY